jgi:predicted amidohydrolase
MPTSRIALANIQYPSTPERSVDLAAGAVRAAARAGAELVCFPECYIPGYRAPGGRLPPPAENTCFVATVNCAGVGSPTTSAVVRPDGTLLAYQPYGRDGLLLADIDVAEATGLMASRYKPQAVT